MFQELLASIAASLTEREIPYMVIGGQAVLLYGEPRLTGDIDITLGLSTDRLSDVLMAAENIGLAPLTEDLEDFVSRTMVLPVRHKESGIRVDFIFSFTPYEVEAIARAHMIDLSGQKVAFASPEDLIIHKVFAGRPRDLEDVRSVLLRNRSLDIEYIRHWLREFDTGEEGGSFAKAFEDILRDWI